MALDETLNNINETVINLQKNVDAIVNKSYNEPNTIASDYMRRFYMPEHSESTYHMLLKYEIEQREKKEKYNREYIKLLMLKNVGAMSMEEAIFAVVSPMSKVIEMIKHAKLLFQNISYISDKNGNIQGEISTDAKNSLIQVLYKLSDEVASYMDGVVEEIYNALNYVCLSHHDIDNKIAMLKMVTIRCKREIKSKISYYVNNDISAYNSFFDWFEVGDIQQNIAIYYNDTIPVNVEGSYSVGGTDIKVNTEYIGHMLAWIGAEVLKLTKGGTIECYKATTKPPTPSDSNTIEYLVELKLYHSAVKYYKVGIQESIGADRTARICANEITANNANTFLSQKPYGISYIINSSGKQTTRIPGTFNHIYAIPSKLTLENIQPSQYTSAFAAWKPDGNISDNALQTHEGCWEKMLVPLSHYCTKYYPYRQVNTVEDDHKNNHSSILMLDTHFAMWIAASKEYFSSINNPLAADARVHPDGIHISPDWIGMIQNAPRQTFRAATVYKNAPFNYWQVT